MKPGKKRCNRPFFAGLLLCLTVSASFGQEDLNPVYSFPFDSLYTNNFSVCTSPAISPSGYMSVLFKPLDESVRFRLPGYDEGVPYNSSSYLVIDLEHHNPASLIVLLEFKRQGDVADQNGWVHSRISSRIGILPGLQTRIVFPLSYLNAQKIFLPRMPRQLKGTVSGNRMEIREIDEVYIRLMNTIPGKFPQEAFINGIYIFENPPPALPALEEPIVDSLGQWKQRKWKGKTTSISDLSENLAAGRKAFKSESNGGDRSVYMGFKSLKFDSTGFFHTHNDGERWWLVDPSGYAYLSIAPTGVRAFSHGPVEKNEDLFEWLPPDTGLYQKAYSKQNGLKSLSFITLNLIRVWDRDFLSEWLDYTSHLIKSLGFTGSANWSDPMFHKDGGLPYFYPMIGFPTTEIKIFRDFPDVFDPEFRNSALDYAKQLQLRKNDPMMIGYFLGNEPHWAFGEFNLAREMMYKNEQSNTREQLIMWLAKKYEQDPYQLSAAWNYEFQDFQELKYFILPHENDISEKAEADLSEFTEIMVEEYISTICDATREADPNHLNLGLRFAWVSSKSCLQTGRYFDVFSLNGYTFPDPPETSSVSKALNKPVLIGEFHFGSIDRGLPATGIKGVRSQRARGIAYRHYVEQGFARPEIVGIHYFQWNDQPVTGRFDGENYNIGIIDVTGQPYGEMAIRIKKTNFRIFEVARGLTRPFGRVPRDMPAIYY